MPSFAYIITEPDGTRREDRLRSNSYEAAWSQLTKRGWKIISLREVRIAEQAQSNSIVDQISTAVYRVRTAVPLQTLVFFTRQLATMFSAGLTIEKSVANLMEEEKSGRFRKVLAAVATDLKRGKALSEALAEHPGVFDSLYIALVKAGEISGSLNTVLDELSNYLEAVAETRSKVVSALTYPVIIVLFMIVILTALLIFIVPMFTDIYANFGASLPIHTRMLIAISTTLSENFVASVGITIVAFIAIWTLTLTERGGIAWDTFRIKFPVLGQLHVDSMMNRFSKTFGILMGAGVPVLEGIDHCRKVVGNRVIQRALDDVKTMVKDGFSISVSMKKTGKFPSTLVQLVATGEETGEMDRLLDRAAYFYEKQVEAISERLTSLIQPMMIILLGGVVLVILVSIYLPIFQIGRVMQSGLG
jgi:type IV pilus assembly protein PilC